MKFQTTDLVAQLYETTCWPKKNWETKEVIVDEAGNKTYQVKALVSSGKRTEVIEVNVKAPNNPVEAIEALAPIKFSGVYISMGTFKGKKYATLNAESVKKA